MAFELCMPHGSPKTSPQPHQFNASDCDCECINGNPFMCFMRKAGGGGGGGRGGKHDGNRRRLARGPRSGGGGGGALSQSMFLVPWEDHRVVSTECRQVSGTQVQVLMRVTLLAAGFVIGARGNSARLIVQATGALVHSWTEPDHALIPIRLFRIQGQKHLVQGAVHLIYQAVAKYRDLCECKRRGEFVQREHIINGVEFYYQPPPKKAFFNNINLHKPNDIAPFEIASSPSPQNINTVRNTNTIPHNNNNNNNNNNNHHVWSMPQLHSPCDFKCHRNVALNSYNTHPSPELFHYPRFDGHAQGNKHNDKSADTETWDVLDLCLQEESKLDKSGMEKEKRVVNPAWSDLVQQRVEEQKSSTLFSYFVYEGFAPVVLS